jgi:hypothetical protein
MRSRLLPPPDRQGAQAPPAGRHTRGLEANVILGISLLGDGRGT